MKLNKETKVGIFTVAVLLILAYFSIRVGKIHIFKQPTYTISAYFSSASGIEKGTAVTMAGIKIGTVENIKLERGMARVYMAVYSKYKVYPDYIASIRSLSLLGESYISISPAYGGEARTQSLNKEVIKSEMSSQSMSAMITKFAKTADNLEKVSVSLRNSIGTKTGEKNIKAILNNMATLSENLNRLIDLNRKNVDVILENFASISRHINGLTLKNEKAVTDAIHNFDAISYNLREQLPEITKNIKGLSENLNTIVAKNKGNINQSLENINEDTKKLKLTLNQIYGISSKINNGKGTLGKLVNRDSVYNNLNGSLKGLNGLMGGFSQFQVKMNLNSIYLVKSQSSVSQVNVKLQPSPGHYYELGIASVPMGYGNTFGETSTTTYVKNSGPGSGSQFYPSSVTTETTQYSYSNNVKFNALIAKNYYNFTLLAGLLYSTGGVGINYYVPYTDNDLELYARAFGFNSQSSDNNINAYVDAGLDYTFYRHLYVDAGYDDIFGNNNRSVYVGGGVKFNDKDLKYLIVGGKIP